MTSKLLLSSLCAVLLGSATPPLASRAPAAEVIVLPGLPYDFSGLTWPTFVTAPPGAPAPPAPPRPDRGVRILVSLPQQKAWVFDDGALVATSPVSTGKRGHSTPAGTFPILQKKVHHRSNKYSNAPMPYMQRLTWGGVALHAGSLPGYPASHGCIRLPRAFAKKLYELTDHGTLVTVTRQRAKSAHEALKLV
jgi:lipoprotein-anchoring transpeptidase ErfK/SrfK